MKTIVRFEAQVRRAAGTDSISVDVDDGATVGQLLQQLAEDADEPVRRILVDERGDVRPTVLVFLNEEHLPRMSDRRLSPGDSVTITSPISGG